MNARIAIPTEQVAEFCQRNQILRLALFGSVLRDDFTPESDVDILVEFEPDARIGFAFITDSGRTFRHPWSPSGFAHFPWNRKQPELATS